MATRAKKGQLVLITWDDIRVDPCTEGNPEPIVSKSMGMVDATNRWWVRLANSWYEDVEFEQCRDTIVIPRGCIRNIRVFDDTDEKRNSSSGPSGVPGDPNPNGPGV